MPETTSLPLIGVFTKQLDNWQSGSGHHLNEIMTRVLALNDAHPRFRFVFIHYKPSSNPIYQRVEELIVPRNPLAASWVLRKRGFAILHYTPLTFFAPLWGLKAKKVATIHGAEQLIVPQFYGTLEMVHERFLVPLYARKMDHILTVSHTSRGFFMGRYRVPGDRITVCPNAVSSLYRVLPGRSLYGEAAHPSSSNSLEQARAVLSRFGLSPGDPYLFHLSRFSERKNPWTILEGFQRFLQLPAPKYPLVSPATEPNASLQPKVFQPGRGTRDRGMEADGENLQPATEKEASTPLFHNAPSFPSPSAFKLVIGGSRWDNPAVDRFLEQAKIADRVIRTGFLKEEEAVAFYNYAAVFLFPSLAEGFGMPNLEAMACGCPVITSNVFAIPEVVGDAALVLKNPLDAEGLARAIQRVVYEETERQRLVQRGLERVKQFDWDESARRVMEVYEGLVAGRLGGVKI